jgi:HEAT repeats
MAEDPAHGQPRRRGLIWKLFAMRPMPEGPADETHAQRLDRGRAWLSSDSPEERATGLAILGGMDRDEALEPLLKALDDPDKRVRTTAFLYLLWHDPPEGHGERVVAELGGESRAAERFVQERWAPGAIGSLGLTDRLLPHLEHITRTGTRRKDRRRAAAYVRILRDHPPGWPMTDESFPTQST